MGKIPVIPLSSMATAQMVRVSPVTLPFEGNLYISKHYRTEALWLSHLTLGTPNNFNARSTLSYKRIKLIWKTFLNPLLLMVKEERQGSHNPKERNFSSKSLKLSYYPSIHLEHYQNDMLHHCMTLPLCFTGTWKQGSDNLLLVPLRNLCGGKDKKGGGGEETTVPPLLLMDR